MARYGLAPLVFMPVQMMPEAMATSCKRADDTEPSAVAGAVAEDRRIEIALPDGTCIRVGADVGLAALRRVMAALRG